MKTELEWKDPLKELPEHGEKVLVVDDHNNVYHMVLDGDRFVPDTDNFYGLIYGDYLSYDLFAITARCWARVASPLSVDTRPNIILDRVRGVLRQRDLSIRDVATIWNLSDTSAGKLLRGLLREGYATREKVNGSFVYSHNPHE